MNVTEFKAYAQQNVDELTEENQQNDNKYESYYYLAAIEVYKTIIAWCDKHPDAEHDKIRSFAEQLNHDYEALLITGRALYDKGDTKLIERKGQQMAAALTLAQVDPEFMVQTRL